MKVKPHVKWISFVLVLVMMLSLLAPCVYASEAEAPSDVQTTEATTEETADTTTETELPPAESTETEPEAADPEGTDSEDLSENANAEEVIDGLSDPLDENYPVLAAATTADAVMRVPKGTVAKFKNLSIVGAIHESPAFRLPYAYGFPQGEAVKNL